MKEIITTEELREILNRIANRKGVPTVAKEIGVSRDQISRAKNGDAPLGVKIPAYLGYKKVTMYEADK